MLHICSLIHKKNFEMAAKKIETIIFDLGGVIINLDTEATLKALDDLVQVKHEASPKDLEHEIFLQYEKGNIDDAAFRAALKKVYQFNENIEDHHYDEAWNKMLLDIPLERINLLKALRKKYPLFLLSNTNFIHIEKVNKILEEQTGVKKLNDLFDKIYYSFEMNMRKPDLEIFEFVLKENDLDPTETLFIDDNVHNIRGAAKLNIQTLHVTGPNIIFDYFKNEI